MQVASGISDLTDIQNAADGSGRLFLVQQNGVIRILRNGALLTAPFLDIRDKTRAEASADCWVWRFPRASRRSSASTSTTRI